MVFSVNRAALSAPVAEAARLIRAGKANELNRLSERERQGSRGEPGNGWHKDTIVLKKVITLSDVTSVWVAMSNFNSVPSLT